MLAIVLATGVSHLLSRDTIYTRKLLRRGIDIDEPADTALRRRPVEAFMSPPPEPVPADADLRTVAARFSRTGETCVPVVDADGRHVGLISVGGLMDALAAGEDTDLPALMAGADPVAPDAPIEEVLNRLDRGVDAVAVAEGDALIGWVRHRDVLAAMTRTPA
ncbi:MAG: CBS domain-containing protein [Blastococcus sp.]